jgi:hypothetical protein
MPREIYSLASGLGEVEGSAEPLDDPLGDPELPLDDAESDGEPDGDGELDGDGESEGDGEGESDGDGDGESEGDGDGESDGDGDGESEGDGDGESDGDGDGECDGDGLDDGDGDGDGECVGAGVGTVGGATGFPLPSTAGTTRVAPKKADHQTVAILTFSPVCGASIILPLPMYMPTCEMVCQSVRLVVLKNTRSPGSRSSMEIGVVACSWYRARRGIVTPACWYESQVRPEQSNEFGPSAPNTYGLPSCSIAHATAASALGLADWPCTLVLTGKPRAISASAASWAASAAAIAAALSVCI